MAQLVADFFQDAENDVKVFQFEIEDMIKGIDNSGDNRVQKEELKEFIQKAMGIKGGLAP